jgi:DNA-binding PadR family transcriptional regulator
METHIDGVNHGRIYPNLDKLVEYSLVTKGSLDQRTNYYEITDRGKALLSQRRRWENRYITLPQVLAFATVAMSTRTGIPVENGFLSKISRFL